MLWPYAVSLAFGDVISGPILQLVCPPSLLEAVCLIAPVNSCLYMTVIVCIFCIYTCILHVALKQLKLAALWLLLTVGERAHFSVCFVFLDHLPMLITFVDLE